MIKDKDHRAVIVGLNPKEYIQMLPTLVKHLIDFYNNLK